MNVDRLKWEHHKRHIICDLADVGEALNEQNAIALSAFHNAIVTEMADEIAKRDARIAELEARVREQPLMFPIMNAETDCAVSAIPWEMIAPFEAQAKQNHSQTLERLANRGGLSPMEAYCVMNGLSCRAILWKQVTPAIAKEFLEERFGYVARLLARIRELEGETKG